MTKLAHPHVELEGASYAKAMEGHNDPNFNKDVHKKLRDQEKVCNGATGLRLCEDCNDGEPDHVKMFLSVKRPYRRAFMNALCRVCGVKTWAYDRADQPGDTPNVTQDQLVSPPVHTFIKSQKKSKRVLSKT